MTLSIRRHDEKEKDPEPTSSYVKLKLKPTSIKESVLYTERDSGALLHSSVLGQGSTLERYIPSSAGLLFHQVLDDTEHCLFWKGSHEQKERLVQKCEYGHLFIPAVDIKLTISTCLYLSVIAQCMASIGKPVADRRLTRSVQVRWLLKNPSPPQSQSPTPTQSTFVEPNLVYCTLYAGHTASKH